MIGLGDKMRCAALVFVLVGLAACAPPIYFARAMHGTVVDAETKQPIAGAVLVANWDLFHELWGGGSHSVKSIQITEAVADARGEYAIPGWGPKLRPCYTYLDHYDPYLIVFKSGYVPVYLMNEKDRNGIERVSEWNGKTIELKPFRGTPKERFRQLDFLVDVCRVDMFRYHPVPLNALYDEVVKERDFVDQAGRWPLDVEKLKR